MSTYLDRVKPYVGTTAENGKYTVDASQIRKFAATTLETDPIYFDEEYAGTTPYGTVIAPPTFFRVFAVPPFHPVQGAVLPVRGSIHAKEETRLFKPMKAGDRVNVRTTLTDAYEKEGRSGCLLFLVMEQAFLDETGAPYVISETTQIYDRPLLETREASFYTRSAMAPDGDWLAELAPCDPTKVQAGDGVGPVQLPEITRNWIAQWAGASGDYNPIHLDDEKARAAGHPGVIAHGMLSAAVANRIFCAWLGADGRMTKGTVKFVRPVRPGDRLTLLAEVTGVERTDGRTDVAWSYTVRNGADVVVLTGEHAGVLPR